MRPVYLDYNATTPIDPQVAEAMRPYIDEHFGNPSSSHSYGVTAAKAVAKARSQVAAVLHCRPDSIVFTSGGTESNNYALKGVAFSNANKSKHIITSAIEHPAIIQVCRYLERQGFQVTYLPVDGYGMVDPRQLEAALTAETILVSIMLANNEVGTIEPIREITEIAHRHGVPVHTDAAQAIGKMPVHIDELQVDLLSVAGHKLYAPKGVGALYIGPGVQLEKLMHGADHERNLRAGTENVIEIVGLGEACALVAENLPAYLEQMRNRRDRLEGGLQQRFPQIRLNGHPEKRLPNTSSVSFPHMEANTLLAQLEETVAASAGAACHSGEVAVSSVLQAMRVPVEYAMGTLRFSVGRFTTTEEIDRALERISAVVSQQPSHSPNR